MWSGPSLDPYAAPVAAGRQCQRYPGVQWKISPEKRPPECPLDRPATKQHINIERDAQNKKRGKIKRFFIYYTFLFKTLSYNMHIKLSHISLGFLFFFVKLEYYGLLS